MYKKKKKKWKNRAPFWYNKKENGKIEQLFGRRTRKRKMRKSSTFLIEDEQQKQGKWENGAPSW
jgi:hypothetical protein